MNSDGTNQQLVTNNNTNECEPAWRPTGSSGIEDWQDNIEFPNKVKLLQNYPNPFNPNTTIMYRIPELSFVTLKVYDVLGNEVATLVEEEKKQGMYNVLFGGTGLSSGVYYYELRIGDFAQTKKMILIQ